MSLLVNQNADITRLACKVRRSFAEKGGIRGKEDDNGLIKKLSPCNGLSLICHPGPCMDLFSL